MSKEGHKLGNGIRGGEALLVKSKQLKDPVSPQLGASCLSQTISF